MHAIVQESGTYLLYKPSNFLSKYSTFRYQGNRDRSGANLNDTTKVADLENPQFGTIIVWNIGLSSIQAELYSQFLVKYSDFC